MLKALLLIVVAAVAAFFLSAMIQGIKNAQSMTPEEQQQYLQQYKEQKRAKARERQLRQARNRPTEAQQQTRLLRNLFWLTFFTRRHH